MHKTMAFPQKVSAIRRVLSYPDPFGILARRLPPTKLKGYDRLAPSNQFTTSGIDRIWTHFDRCGVSYADPMVVNTKDIVQSKKPPHSFMMYWEGRGFNQEEFVNLKNWQSKLKEQLGEEYSLTIFTTPQFLRLPEIESIKANLRSLNIHLVCVEDIHQFGESERDESLQTLLNYYGVGSEFSARSDIWRFLLLEWFGGIYLDLDIPPESVTLTPSDQDCVPGAIYDHHVRFYANLCKKPPDFYETFLFAGPRNSFCDHFMARRSSEFTNEMLNMLVSLQVERLSNSCSANDKGMAPFIKKYYTPGWVFRDADISPSTREAIESYVNIEWDPILAIVTTGGPECYVRVRDAFCRNHSYGQAIFRGCTLADTGVLGWANLWNKWEQNPEVLRQEISTFVETRIVHMGCMPVDFLWAPVFNQHPKLRDQVKASLNAHAVHRVCEDPDIGLVVYSKDWLTRRDPILAAVPDNEAFALIQATQIAKRMRFHRIGIWILELSRSFDKFFIPGDRFLEKLGSEYIRPDDRVVLRRFLDEEGNPLGDKVYPPEHHYRFRFEEISIFGLAIENMWSPDILLRIFERVGPKSEVNFSKQDLLRGFELLPCTKKYAKVMLRVAESFEHPLKIVIESGANISKEWIGCMFSAGLWGIPESLTAIGRLLAIVRSKSELVRLPVADTWNACVDHVIESLESQAKPVGTGPPDEIEATIMATLSAYTPDTLVEDIRKMTELFFQVKFLRLAEVLRLIKVHIASPDTESIRALNLAIRQYYTHFSLDHFIGEEDPATFHLAQPHAKEVLEFLKALCRLDRAIQLPEGIGTRVSGKRSRNPGDDEEVAQCAVEYYYKKCLLVRDHPYIDPDIDSAWRHAQLAVLRTSLDQEPRVVTYKGRRDNRPTRIKETRPNYKE